jgi:hypothetical protein
VDVSTGAIEGFLPVRITSPVAYVTSLPLNPFPERKDHRTHESYRYINRKEFFELEPGNAPDDWAERMTNFFGSPAVGKEWQDFSYGPDLTNDDGMVSYEPTNGTVSVGDIARFGP